MYRETIIEDISFIVNNLRQSDLLEIEKISDIDTYDAIYDSYIHSYVCYTLFVKGEPVALMGNVQVNNFSSTPWLVGTDKINSYPVAFTKMVKEILKQFNCFDLYNFVYSENTKTKIWLKYLGFELGKPFKYGEKGNLFNGFFMKANTYKED